MLRLLSYAPRPQLDTSHLQGRRADDRGCARDSPCHERGITPQGREFLDQMVI